MCYFFLDMKDKIAWLIAPLAVAIGILVVCCLPAKDFPEMENNIPYLDKVIHFVMYATLSATAIISYRKLKMDGSHTPVWFVCCLLAPILWGGGVELIQHYYCEGRSGDVYDLLANSLGSASVTFISYRRGWSHC